MYRKYREGDLPDIQIKHSDLITPLQALAQVCICIYRFAIQLHSKLYNSMVFMTCKQLDRLLLHFFTAGMFDKLKKNMDSNCARQ